MWTYIKKDDVEEYLKQYPQLAEDFESLILLDTNDAFFLPRLFSVNYPSKHLCVFTGKQESYAPTKIDVKFTGTLRDKQHDLVNTFLKIYKDKGYVNGIAKSYPGSGKTFMAIYLAAQWKIKTLIIVDNQNLMKQWIKTIIDFTNLTVDDIGIIQQKHLGLEKPIIIAMGQTLQSYLKRGIQEAFKLMDKAGIGLVVYDEVHTTSAAPVFSKISLLFRTRNIIGLSASPFHIGTQEILMHNTIGNIVYETKNYDMKPTYRLLFYKSALDSKKLFVISKMTEYLHRKALYNKLIISSDNYKNLILEQTRKMRALGHRIIIICFTKIQVTTISEMLEINGLKNTRFYGEEREIDFTENILVVTYSFCGKGFDFPALSCLILATPLAGRKSLIQVIGRILRTDHNKIAPVVIDLADMSLPFFTLPEVRVQYC